MSAGINPEVVGLFDHQPRVLVVDDDEEIASLVCAMLASLGLEATFETSADQALARMKEACADVVVSDIQMPGCSGLDLLRRVSAIGLEPGFVFVTGYGAPESMIEAVRLGALDFLLKPFRRDDLAQSMDRSLAIVGRQRKAYALIEELGVVAPQTKDMLEDLRRQSAMLKALAPRPRQAG